MTSETEMQMVQRHVREGAAILLRQTAIVAGLEKAGNDATMAEILLESFEAIQDEHIAHLARITERDRKLK